jgi:hypothetical protein
LADADTRRERAVVSTDDELVAVDSPEYGVGRAAHHSGELEMTRRISAVAVCCSSASASRFRDSARRFSRSRVLASSLLGRLRAGGRTLLTFAFLGLARRLIRGSLDLIGREPPIG